MPIKCQCDSNSCKLHDKCKCGKKKKVVSDSCRSCYYSNMPKYACQVCGKKRKKTVAPICRDCYNKSRTDRIVNDDTPISELFYYANERNKNNGVRARARALIDSLGIDKVCSCCSFEVGIQICHIKPINKFDDNTPLNVVNSLDNLILLCPNCHWLFDHGYNSLEKLKEFYSTPREN